MKSSKYLEFLESIRRLRYQKLFFIESKIDLDSSLLIDDSQW